MSSTTPTILVVEPDEATRQLYLRELGRVFRVVAAHREQDVLDLLRSETIQAVVLEPATPGEPGWQLFDAITHVPLEQKVPVVLCSTLDERKWGMEMGAAAYLVKPVTPAMLVETLVRVIHLQGSAHEFREHD